MRAAQLLWVAVFAGVWLNGSALLAEPLTEPPPSPSAATTPVPAPGGDSNVEQSSSVGAATAQPPAMQSPAASVPAIGAAVDEAQPDPVSDGEPADAIVPPAPDFEEQPEITAAELAELGFDLSGDAPTDTALQLYGFVDFSVHAVVGSRDWQGLLLPHPSFYIGNFNLYISKNLLESVRMFSEIRFTYLPNGASTLQDGSGRFTTTVAPDYADASRPLRYGSIEIERVYLEWAPDPLFTLRVGQYLTPYGIWNVDHGSPAIVSVLRPLVIGQQLFPERQMGFEVLGRWSLSARQVVGYHLTLSNGLGPVSEYRDLDANKAVGGRLYWIYEGLGQLQLGVSGFFGADTSARSAVGLGPTGDLFFKTEIDSQSYVFATAADVRWRYNGLLLQSEIVSQQRRYTAAGRVGIVHPYTGEWIAPMDAISWGAYLLAGYRFEWLGVMPYLQLQYSDFSDPSVNFVSARFWSINGGLNIRPVDSIVVKLEVMRAYWPDGFLVTEDPATLLNLQLAWAF